MGVCENRGLLKRTPNSRSRHYNKDPNKVRFDGFYEPPEAV